jgi:hypothetical protein
MKRVPKGRIIKKHDGSIDSLLAALNQTPETERESEATNEVRDLFQRLQTVSQAESILSGLSRLPGQHNLEVQRAAWLERLNRSLREHPVFMQVMEAPRRGRNDPYRLQTAWRLADEQKGESPLSDLIVTLLKITDSGRFGLIMECKLCSKWFFARVRTQNFCSDACRNEFHVSNPGDKRRRAEWARKSYQSRKRKPGK